MNKNIKRIVGFMFAMILITGQFMAGVTDAQAAKSPKLNRTNLTMTVGKSKKLKVRNGRNIKWSSSNKAVVTVSKNGTVKAKKAGKATIIAKVYKKRLKCKVVVKKKESNTNNENSKSNISNENIGSKILVAYFSWSGTSEGIAKNIIKQTGADYYRIERKVPYSNDYATVGYGDAKTEADTNARPEIKNAPKSIDQYDKIVLCYPIWWHTAPMTVGTFLEKYDFTGKIIYPVSQSASMDRSQFKTSVAFVKTNAKGATVDDGIFTTNSTRIKEYIDQKVLEK